MTTENTQTFHGPDGSVASASKNPALAAALRDMEAKKNRSPWRKRLMMSGVGLLVLLVLAAGAWAIKSRKDANARDKFIASLQEDPRKLWEAERNGQITREERDQAMDTAREQREDKQMDEFFALKTPAERNKYLDKMLDEGEARRRDWQQRAATQPTTRPSRRPTTQSTTRPTTRPNRPFDPARQLSGVQGGNPVRKAQRAEFRAAMRQRMAQRGMQPGRGGWGGMRGGGGGGRRG
jgi:hypothetical protein